MSGKQGSPETLRLLQTAIDLEEKGKAFFQQAAATTRSEFARRTFLFLAAEEDRHIERIKQFYSDLEQLGEGQTPEVESSDAEDRLASFNETLVKLKGEIHHSTSDTEAYRAALAFETGAEDFYADQARTASDPQVRRFYEWLIAEEEMHEALLRSCLEFAEDPVEWFRKHE